MNLKNCDKQDLKGLLSSANDHDGNHIIFVRYDGVVCLETLLDDITPAIWDIKNKGKFKFRCNSFARGAGYVGKKAAKSEEWVNRLFNELKFAWEKNKENLIILED